ncbi:uncharacterized protein CPUR_04368 [Claviceps purpurea 20.1]|uniref:Tc1-like transposase DDE domain-containing protein n=1 Tax=Claviceps purpurea (strain 20.1) TaxID=1111077 RepID=M1W6J5_CLAP2|nr:uncharacterized protein CPUR_04368 [Claviceps purpurea 20.1]
MLDGDTIFMHDNAPIHTAKIVKECLEELEVTPLEWPPYKPRPESHREPMVMLETANLQARSERGAYEKVPGRIGSPCKNCDKSCLAVFRR